MLLGRVRPKAAGSARAKMGGKCARSFSSASRSYALGSSEYGVRARASRSPSGDALEEQCRRVALERLDRDLDDLGVSRRHREGDAERLGVGDARVEARGEEPQRLGVGRAVGHDREELAEAAAAGRDDDQVVPVGQPIELADGHRTGDDVPSALLEVLQQRRDVETVVDGKARVGEVAGELERWLDVEVVIVAAVRRARVVPVVDPELSLTSARVMMVRHRVRQPSLAQLVCRPLCIERRLEPPLLQQQREMQPGGAGSDDADVRHGGPPLCGWRRAPGARARPPVRRSSPSARACCRT